MKKSKLILVITLIIIITVVFCLVIIYSLTGNTTFFSTENYKMENVLKPEYHFVIIAQNTDDPFWQSVRKGAMDAAKELNVAIEFNGPRFTNITEQQRYFDIAVASKVDGIATHVLDEDSFTPLINKAVSKNIPVVTIETDAKNSKRQSFVGINNFQLGADGGKLIAEATGGKAKVAVVLNSYGNEVGDVIQNLRIAGFKSAIKDARPGIEIKTIKSSVMGIFSAEEVTSEIINNYPDINAIFCTNSKDTLGVAQLVVDLNRVGEITIVGYGDLPEILRYVEKGVIYGSIVSNPVNMGYESIKALVELKKKNKTSSYVDTGLRSVTRKNLSQYMDFIEKKGKQDNSK